MKTILLSVLSIFLLSSCAFSQEEGKKQNEEMTKVIIIYFSATGTTAEIAKKIANQTNGDLHEIVPEALYTNEDLNWRNKNSRASVEMNDSMSRPAIKTIKENISDYNKIFIGYPIWWNIAPRIVNTFIESHDLKGKTIIPFATSGSSSIDNSVEQLRKTYPDLVINEGKLLNNANDQTIKEWTISVLKK